jgi:hypothetical protein
MPEISPPLEHARHVQSLNVISCIPSVTSVLFLLEIESNCRLFITYPKQENSPERKAALQSVKRVQLSPPDRPIKLVRRQGLTSLSSNKDASCIDVFC